MNNAEDSYLCRSLKIKKSPMLESLGLAGLFIAVMLSGSIGPFSSDAIYVAALLSGKFPVWETMVVAISGNWLGLSFTWAMGRFAKWEWVEKLFKVKHETIERQKVKIDRFGIWLALLAWVPFIGEAMLIALGFYRSKTVPTLLMTLVGVAARFYVWTLVLGA